MVRRLAPALVAAIVIALYLPSLHAAIVWDDHVLLEHGVKCRSQILTCLVTPLFPTTPFVDMPQAYYRPVVTMSYALFGGGATGQHLVNVLVHALDAALLALVGLRFGASPVRASLAALAWALHPRLVEDVTWISGRTDVLAAAFVLGALLAWPDEGAPRERERQGLAAVLVLFGLLSKEVAVAGVVALAAISGLRRARVLAVPVFVYAALRLAIAGATSFASALGPGARVATIGEATARYAEMALRFARPWSARGAIGVVDTTHAVLGFALLAALAYGAYRAFRGSARGVAAGAALGLGSLLPVLHFVPISLHGAVTADRALYLPLAGLAITLATARWPERSVRPAAALFLALIGAEAIFLVPAQHAFDDEVLFGITVAERADPADVGPISVLATIARDAGAPEVACPLFEAAQRTLQRTGRRAGTTYARASENLGACLALTGRYDASVAVYRAIAEERPRSGRIALGLGYAYLHDLDFDEARAAFDHAAELDPKVRGLALSMKDATGRAAVERSQGESPVAAHRARYAASVGRAPEAEQAFLMVVRDPSVDAPSRRDALRYLVEEGSPPAAHEALREAPHLADARITDVVARRVSAYERVIHRRDRIASLAGR